MTSRDWRYTIFLSYVPRIRRGLEIYCSTFFRSSGRTTDWMLLSASAKKIYSCNQDGNLFVFAVTIEIGKTVGKNFDNFGILFSDFSQSFSESEACQKDPDDICLFSLQLRRRNCVFRRSGQSLFCCQGDATDIELRHGHRQSFFSTDAITSLSSL